MKSLVTGGAGFIGSNLVDFLLEKGHEVIVLDDLSTGFERNIPKNVKFVKADISDEEVWKNLEEVDYIFHLAAMVSVEESIREPLKCQKLNVDAILFLLDYARRVKLKKLVFASSAAIYGDLTSIQEESQTPLPKSPYGLSKLVGEHLIRMDYENNQGPSWVAFRMFNVYGPRQSVGSAYASVIPIFITKALKNENMSLHGDGLQTRDFVFVKQVVNCYYQAAMGEKIGVYNLGNAGSKPIVDLAKDILFLCKESSSKVVLSPPRPGDIRVSQANNQKLLKDFNLPKVDFIDSLKQTIDYYSSFSS